MKKKNETEQNGVTRRNFIGATALAGVASTSLGSLAGISPAHAKTKDGMDIHVGPGELDEYYGFWSGGQSGEVRIVGIPSMRELMRIPVFNIESAPAGASPTKAKLTGGKSNS